MLREVRIVANGKARPGEHLCAKHQGNGSHYAEDNCTLCKALEANATPPAFAEVLLKLAWGTR